MEQWTPTEYQHFWTRYGVLILIGWTVATALGIVGGVGLLRLLGWLK